MSALNEPSVPSLPAPSPDAVPRVPPPGSSLALSGGCLCPTVENQDGKREPDGWVTVAGALCMTPGLVRREVLRHDR